jgi:hypothetical protein
VARGAGCAVRTDGEAGLVVRFGATISRDAGDRVGACARGATRGAGDADLVTARGACNGLVGGVTRRAVGAGRSRGATRT